MSKIIYQRKIEDLLPVLWYGQRVPDKFVAIYKVIASQLGVEVADILSQPQLSESSYEGKSMATWLSKHATGAMTSIATLGDSEKQMALDLLNQRLDQIQKLGQKLLLSEKEENVKWGQLILKAIVFPSLEFVFYSNSTVIISFWGFEKQSGPTGSSSYVLERESSALDLDSSSTVKNDDVYPGQLEEDASPTSALDDKYNSSLDHKDENRVIASEKDGKESSSTENIISQTQLKEQRESPPSKNPNRFWWLLLLLLLPFFWYLWNKAEKQQETPKSTGQLLIPIEADKIIISKDSVRYIVSDRLNIALHGDNRDLESFAKELKKQYPTESIEIIYQDEKTARLQIQVPESELEAVKNSLESKMSGYDLLIWHESIFKSNSTSPDPGLSDIQKSWYFNEVQAQDAWKITKGNPDIVIAILDSGFDVEHPELKSKVFKPWDVISRSSDIQLHPEYSIHGTHVASIASGESDNGLGVSGIAPHCKIMPIKVADYNGTMATSYVIDGFLYAINNGAHVINMSLGLHVNPNLQYYPEEHQMAIIRNQFKEEEAFWNQLFSIAAGQNVAVVLAGGNQNILIGIDPMDRSDYPIKVSATAQGGIKAAFSNWGYMSDVSAPGENIFNAIPNKTFDFLNGTSMAAPIVAGATALIKSNHPDFTPSEIKALLKNTGISAYSPNGQHIGNIIQINDALLAAKNGNTPKADCNDIQSRIDSLTQEINRLRRECLTPIKVDTMHIPSIGSANPQLIQGRWKSSSPLVNDRTEENIELYFDFELGNSGRITLVEQDGTICEANINWTIDNNLLVFNQLQNAICEDDRSYSKYSFSCQPDKRGNALCVAKRTNKSGEIVDFTLIRIK